MARWRNLLGWAADGLLAAPGRGVLAVLTIAFSLFWLISGLALSEGLRAQARAALRGGADLFIGADAFGLDAPIGIDRAQQLAALPGVEAVVPRILGRARVADRWVVIAALDPIAANTLPPERQPALPASGMVALGAELAAALHARVGTRLVLEVVQARVFEVARVFDAAAGLGSANTVLMAFDDAQALFARTGDVSDLLLYCRPGYAEQLAELIATDAGLRVQTSSLVASYLDRAYTLRSGVLMAMFAATLTLLVPLFLMISDLGLSSRRRELAILKASGWTNRDVLEMVLIENLLIGAGGALLAALLSYVWVAVLGAPLLRTLFIAEASAAAHVTVLPWRFSPLPVAIGAAMSLLVTLTGGILSVFRSTTVAPAVAMRR